MKPRRSLQARALQWLAQREYSRAELTRKLLPHAVAEAGASAEREAEFDVADTDTAEAEAEAEAEVGAGARAGATAISGAASRGLTPTARVDAVLDWLEAHDYLSQQRFVESRVHARAARFGNLRIHQELKRHQVALGADAAQALKDSEWQRACAVRERKFALAPLNAAEHARQARFLAGRGFSSEVIRRVLRAAARPGDGSA